MEEEKWIHFLLLQKIKLACKVEIARYMYKRSQQ